MSTPHTHVPFLPTRTLGPRCPDGAPGNTRWTDLAGIVDLRVLDVSALSVGVLLMSVDNGRSELKHGASATRMSAACVIRWPDEVELNPVDEGVVVDRAGVCGAPTEAL